MILERAEILIKDGMMDEFLAVLKNEAQPLTDTFTGCSSWKALKGVEDRNSVMFLAEWESIEVHVASRAEPAHVKFRELVLPFAQGAKETVHFVPV